MQRKHADRPLFAIVVMIAAVAMLVAMNSAIKLIGPDYHVFQIVFLRNLVAMFVVLPMVLRDGGTTAFRTKRPGMQLARSVTGVASVCCFYYAVQRMPVAEMIVISQAVPFVVTALAVFVLRESVGWRRWAAIVAGFVGVVVAMGPVEQVSNAALFALVGTCLWSVTFLLVRSLGATDSPSVTTFYYMVFGTVVMGLVQPWFWKTLTTEVIVLIVIAGFLGAFGQVMIAHAMRFGEASLVTPFNYAAIVWAVLIDLIIWGTVPTKWTWAGAAIIVAAGVYMSWRESIAASARGGRGGL